MHLDRYNKGDYTPGASIFRQVLWYCIGAPLLESRCFATSSFKVFLLRLFGARIGVGVRIKPGVRVKFPWRLEVGSHSWIGESTWIDNLAQVTIGEHCCLSQGVYLCTGSHDWSQDNFQLRTTGIVIGDHVWIAAKAVVGPGVTVEEYAVLTLGSVALQTMKSRGIYRGNPAVHSGERQAR